MSQLNCSGITRDKSPKQHTDRCKRITGDSYPTDDPTHLPCLDPTKTSCLGHDYRLTCSWVDILLVFGSMRFSEDKGLV